MFSRESASRKRRLQAFALRTLTHARITDIAKATGLSPSAVSHAIRSLDERCRRETALRDALVALADLLQ